MVEKVWTAEEDKRLSEMWIQGEATSVIAQKLTDEFGRHITKNSVVSRRKRIPGLLDRGNPIKGRVSEEAKSRAINLLLNGSSIKAVSDNTSVSKNVIYKLRQDISPPATKREPIPFERPAKRKSAPTPTVFRYIPHAKCLSPDGCSETIAPHSPYAYCAKHRRKYYAYDPMTDRGRDTRVWTPWANSTKPEVVEDLEKAE